MADDVTLPGAGVAVDTEQQADGSHQQVVSIGQAIKMAIANLLGLAVDPATGRLRATMVLEAAQTLSTVTTVTTVTTCSTVTTCATLTNQAQMGSVPLNSFVFDQMNDAWANCLRGRIT